MKGLKIADKMAKLMSKGKKRPVNEDPKEEAAESAPQERQEDASDAFCPKCGSKKA